MSLEMTKAVQCFESLDLVGMTGQSALKKKYKIKQCEKRETPLRASKLNNILCMYL
jgi:hypothetical protein